MNEDDVMMSLQFCPTEVLLYIFTFLPPKQLTNCRQVCWRWKHIVDSLIRSEPLWQRHCKTDFPHVCNIAHYKSRPGLLWYNLYRSLALWPKLHLSSEIRDEFASASCSNDEIRDFQILRYGIIGVHKRTSIVYYEADSLQLSKRGSISGNYLRYMENDDTILILGYNLHLFVIRKLITNPRHETNVTFDNVKTFLLIDREVFYVTLNDEIYVCKLNDGNLISILLKRMDNGVMSLGYRNGQLHILTFQREIYTFADNKLIFECTLDESSNLLHDLRRFNFLEHLDWRVYFQWMFVLNHSIPQGPLRDIIIVKTYGDVVFVGSNCGVLRIYYSPYVNNEFNLFNSEPLKQYNFSERSDLPVLAMCPIIQIDVIEGIDNHLVVVAMPKKIAVLNFSYTFKRSASAAMLPYKEVNDVKILKISE